jgi:hypothetical protein
VTVGTGRRAAVSGFFRFFRSCRCCACGIAFIAALAAIAAGGCSSSRETTTPRFPAPPETGTAPEAEPAPAPSPRTTFGYRVQNENCQCAEYATSDRKYPVGYRFRAAYRMEEGFITSINVRFENRGADTLFLDPGSVMVASKNVEYQYNNRFIPLPDMMIPPGESQELDLDGKEVTTAPSWRKIAGEQLTLTLKGMRLGEKILETQVVKFVPENPMLRDED